MKTCTQCGRKQPDGNFYASKQHPGGLHPWCRACTSASRKARYRKNASRIKAEQAQYYKKNTRKVKARVRRYLVKNQERRKAWDRDRYRRNREETIQRVTQHQDAHREERRAYTRGHYRRNKDEYVDARRRRRARQRNAPGTHTAADIRRIYFEQRGRCYYCDKKLMDKYHVDHKIPLDRGGSDWPENLCIACQPCNLSKHTRTAEEFLAARGG